MPENYPLVSNSVSYNLKVSFIRQHPEKLRDADIVVIGSSMSMNNVDAVMLQDSLRRPVVNLSSWQLDMPNFKGSPLWDEPKVFLTNLGVSDFGDIHTQVKDNFSFKRSRLAEFYNFETDFRTFVEMLPLAKSIMNTRDNQDFLSCNFDKCGSVLLNDSPFVKSARRWDLDAYAVFKMDSAAVVKYIRQLKELTRSHHGNIRLFITFSPGRRKFYNKPRSETVAYLGELIHANCPEVLFFNLYDRNYPDSVYAEGCHFNIRGARRFTREVIDSIRLRSPGGIPSGQRR